MAIPLDILLTEEEKEEKKKTTFENPYKEIIKKYEDLEKLTVLIPENIYLNTILK